jgi:stage II sporulation protein D
MGARATALAALACAAFTALPASASADTWIVKGHGWGHGVGMSQYGAYGMAQDGSGYREILRHYYRHTKLGREEGSVRVLLAPDVGSVSFSGATKACGTSLKGNGQYSFGLSGADVVLSRANGEKLANCGPKGSASGGKSVDFTGKGTYRGALVARADAGSLDAINNVGIEAYVKGVVPNEMPPSWDLEALKAQAVAARTYALATRIDGDGFDLYDNTRSQVYGGKGSEAESTNRAVEETAAEVVTYRGEAIVAYYSSTSGGHTESIQYAFPGANAVPYLQGVPDPFDRVSPLHTWRETYTQAEIESRLGGLVHGRLQQIKVLKTGDSPRIVTARVIGSDGSEKASGFQLRDALGLRDTWFRFRRK